VTRLDAGMTWAQIVHAKREAVWESWRLRAEIHQPAPGWHRSALCATAPHIEFNGRAATETALALCEQCDARLDCLAATIHEERHTGIKLRRGVRGGLPATARVTPHVREQPKCGTDAGYSAHWRNGEDACPACKEAHAAANDRRKTKAVA